MGKSTLINTLLPDAAARVGEVSAALNTGKHTTTETTLYRLDEKSWIVDSPGMKEFGLGHLSTDAITAAFVELRPLLGTAVFAIAVTTASRDAPYRTRSRAARSSRGASRCCSSCLPTVRGARALGDDPK